MPSTTFVDKVTTINTAWLNDVNSLVWTVFNGATTPALARTALSLGSLATKSSIVPADLDTNSSPWIFRKDQAAGTYAQVYNNNTGASAVASWVLVTGTANSSLSFQLVDNAPNPYGIINGGSALSTNGMFFDFAQHTFRNAASQNMFNINNTTGIQMYGSAGAAPTGGGKGPGTANAADSFYTNGSLVEHGVCQFRLTLENLVPVSTTDQTAKTLVYMTPFRGNKIALYYNSKWSVYSSAQVQVAVPATTNTPFDVFAYWNGSAVALETLNWTNDTTRATAIDVGTGDNVLCKGGDLTRRYIGTCRTTGVSGQTEDSLQNRFVWNYYNRVARRGYARLTTTRATSSTTAVEMNSEIRNNFIIGVAEEAITSHLFSDHSNNGVNRSGFGIAVDSTTTPTTSNTMDGLEGAEQYMAGMSQVDGPLAIGFHYITGCFYTSGGTVTANGAATGSQGTQLTTYMLR